MSHKTRQDHHNMKSSLLGKSRASKKLELKDQKGTKRGGRGDSAKIPLGGTTPPPSPPGPGVYTKKEIPHA